MPLIPLVLKNYDLGSVSWRRSQYMHHNQKRNWRSTKSGSRLTLKTRWHTSEASWTLPMKIRTGLTSLTGRVVRFTKMITSGKGYRMWLLVRPIVIIALTLCTLTYLWWFMLQLTAQVIELLKLVNL